MRILPVFVAAILAATGTLAQPRVPLTVKSATVFLTGAELSGSAQVSLPAGESELLLTNVATNVSEESLVVHVSSGVVVQSASFQSRDAADSTLSPAERRIRDSIQTLQRRVDMLNDKRVAVDNQLEILEETKKSTGQANSLSVTEVQKLLDLVAARMSGLLAAQRSYQEEMNGLITRIRTLEQQGRLVHSEEKTWGLLLRVYSNGAARAEVDVHYVTPAAKWSPVYDVRVDQVNDPLRLTYKAQVSQHTGIRWEKVKLTLSTGNPSEGAAAPGLRPAYLTGRDLVLEGKIPGILPTQVSQIQGYTNGRHFTLGDTAYLFKDADDGPTVDNSGINTAFDIELPYTIPSDNHDYLVDVKSYEIPATYRYFAVPKADKDVFLQARVAKWEQLNLLPGKANIFFEGSFVGKSDINTRNLTDTMSISLGRDKKVIVRRELDREMTRRKGGGSDMVHEYSFVTTIRNTRREQVHLVILDQVPVSRDASIEVNDVDYGAAIFDAPTGIVKWETELKPSDVQTRRLSYTIRSPKDKAISGL